MYHRPPQHPSGPSGYCPGESQLERCAGMYNRSSFFWDQTDGGSPMRDPDLLLELLLEMAKQPDGRTTIVETLGMGEEERRIIHHMELLADSGHVEWHRPKFPRITNAGYDFIEAVTKNPSIKTVFVEKLKGGLPYLPSVSAALSALS